MKPTKPFWIVWCPAMNKIYELPWSKFPGYSLKQRYETKAEADASAKILTERYPYRFFVMAMVDYHQGFIARSSIVY